MGICKYCDKPVGFLRNKHPECKKQHQEKERAIQEGREKIIEEITKTILGSESFENLEKKISDIEQSSFVPIEERKNLLIKGWENSVGKLLEDGIVGRSEEDRLSDFRERFALSQKELDINGAFTKTAKAAVLRDVINGIIPQRCNIVGNLPINFQKNEQIVWAFPESQYLEDKVRRQYVGGTHGVGIRIMKGVYYRMGAFKGRPVDHVERVHIDTGIVVITNKHIYFAGSRKSLRIPYIKIISFEPYSDGIAVMRDASTAKPQVFITGDGWFTYNLVTNLSKM